MTACACEPVLLGAAGLVAGLAYLAVALALTAISAIEDILGQRAVKRWNDEHPDALFKMEWR